MAVETHEFRVEFTKGELEQLASQECRVPREFIDANIRHTWRLAEAGSVLGLTVAFIQTNYGQSEKE